MSDENVVIELGQTAVEKATDQPRMGDRRLTKMVPTPFGWKPIIWRSPHPTAGVDNPENLTRRGRMCVLLIDKGAGADLPPTTNVSFISDDTWAKLPEDVVEW